MHLLIYALGGGLGHVSRATALGRAAARRGHVVHLLVNSPFARGLPLERELGPAGRVTRLVPERDPARVAPQVEALVGAGGFDALVVDVFPRGLGGELRPLLADLRALRVWVQRDLDPRYVAAARLDEAARDYDLVLQPGEGLPLELPVPIVRTAPWLLRDAHELREPADARAVLGAKGEGPLVLVVASGNADEIAASAGAAERLREALSGEADVLRAAPDPGAAALAWPLLEVLRGVDVLVGAGGYNLVHEARALGVPLVASARPRTYDRQGLRLRPEERADVLDDVLSCVRAHLATATRVSSARPYENGVHQALDAIEQLGASRVRGLPG